MPLPIENLSAGSDVVFFIGAIGVRGCSFFLMDTQRWAKTCFWACPLAWLGAGLLRGSLTLRLAYGETAPSERPSHPSRKAALSGRKL